jgi:hypothetical protein
MYETRIVFEKEYSDETLIDLSDDIEYDMDMEDIPVGGDGFRKGSFHVVITWTPED